MGSECVFPGPSLSGPFAGLSVSEPKNAKDELVDVSTGTQSSAVRSMMKIARSILPSVLRVTRTQSPGMGTKGTLSVTRAIAVFIDSIYLITSCSLD